LRVLLCARHKAGSWGRHLRCLQGQVSAFHPHMIRASHMGMGLCPPKGTMRKIHWQGQCLDGIPQCCS
uniref:Uncharacterized protein n=1 Tax=Coturnix japonica TaxID=93934 RepID=A0A8C2UKL8_COTJA